MSEILAPAGSKNSAFAAINAGADAIYLGLDKFSARSSAENFNVEDFENICNYAHAFGVKVYAALNTIVKDGEIENFLLAVKDAWNKGADALIIQDLFLGKFIKQNFPDVVLHLSTQAGTCNVYGAEIAKSFGFERVILARETQLADIEEISTIIQTEAFVQGALCTCFSGQCFMSSFAGGNSGNRGRCKQPCRKMYSFDRAGFEEKKYRLSLSDLCVGENISDYINAGVYSFKIEGRMRRPEYVAAAVNYYKKVLDKENTDSDLSALKRTYNRGNYTKGLAFGQDKNFISSSVQGHIGEFAGMIQVKNAKYICQSRFKFNSGDGFKILRDGKEVGGGIYGGEVNEGFVIITRDRLKNGDKAFITTDNKLNEKLLSVKKLIPLQIDLEFVTGSLPSAQIDGMKFTGENVLERAKNNPLTKENIIRCFKKVDSYPFYPTCSVKTDGVFMTVSSLNSFRRKVYDEYFKKIACRYKENTETVPKVPNTVPVENGKTAVISCDLNGIEADIGILKLNCFDTDVRTLTRNFHGEKFLFVPSYLTGSEIERVKQIACFFDGIYCDGYYGQRLADELGKSFFAGCGFNVTNRISLENCKARYICLSKELTVNEANALSKPNVFYLSAGNIKVMDLIYCPFEKKCSSCDKRTRYTLTDDAGRKFPVRRYVASECRFEVFNCADLLTKGIKTGRLEDSTFTDGENSNITRGHSIVGIY